MAAKKQTAIFQMINHRQHQKLKDGMRWIGRALVKNPRKNQSTSNKLFKLDVE